MYITNYFSEKTNTTFLLLKVIDKTSLELLFTDI